MGLEQGAIYTLTGPDGTIAVFNDESDPNYVGYLTEPPSIGAEVRESAEEVAEGDGGHHENFYESRLNVVLSGNYGAIPGTLEVKTQIERLDRAAYALREDATLEWEETGDTVTRRIERLRRPTRIIKGGFIPKTFTLTLVSERNLILTDEEPGVTGTMNDGVGVTTTNVGNATMPGRIVIDLAAGAGNQATTLIVKNTTTGKTFKLNGTFTADVEIDFLEKTVTENGVDRYGKYDFLTSTWWGLAPGSNKLEVTDANNIARPFTFYRRHGWVS